MGAPNIKDSLKDNQEAIDAVNKACQNAFEALRNNQQQAVDYISKHTHGIVQELSSDSLWYSKFSEDFKLDALDKIIDETVNIAVDAIKSQAPGDDPELAIKSAKDVGELVKGVLSLAASSSSTDEKLQITFSYIVAGEANYAVYYAFNSTTVEAQNVWGSKNITVIANTYLVAQVKPNPDITRAEMLQKDLDTLKKLNDQYDDAILNVQTEEQLKALTLKQELMQILAKKISAEVEDLNAKAK